MRTAYVNADGELVSRQRSYAQEQELFWTNVEALAKLAELEPTPTTEHNRAMLVREIMQRPDAADLLAARAKRTFSVRAKLGDAPTNGYVWQRLTSAGVVQWVKGKPILASPYCGCPMCYHFKCGEAVILWCGFPQIVPNRYKLAAYRDKHRARRLTRAEKHALYRQRERDQMSNVQVVRR